MYRTSLMIVCALVASPALASSCSGNKQAENHHETTWKVSHHGGSDTKQADIVDTAVGAGNFNTLVAAVKAAGLVDTLKGEGPFTVFAPTDEAFAKIPQETIAHLLTPEGKDLLTKILTYHVVAGKVTSDKVVSLTSADTVQGQSVAIKVVDGKVMINDATVVAADVMTSNGVIHVIDTVLMPQD